MAIIRKSAQKSAEKEVGVIERKQFTRSIGGEKVITFVATLYRPEKGRDVIYLERWNGPIGKKAWDLLEDYVSEETNLDDIVFDD